MEWVAIVALVISIISLCWNVASGVLRWPRLGVVQTKDVFITVGGDHESVRYRVRVIVINTGSEATTIANVGLRTVDRSQDLNVERLQRDGTHGVNGEQVPCRIEPHGSLTWEFEQELLKQFPMTAPLEGFAIRYRKSRGIHIKEYRSGKPDALNAAWKPPAAD